MNRFRSPKNLFWCPHVIFQDSLTWMLFYFKITLKIRFNHENVLGFKLLFLFINQFLGCLKTLKGGLGYFVDILG